jgi:PPP family 3-phenylpropionic acid transporter
MPFPSTATRIGGFFAAAFVSSTIGLVHFPLFLAGRGLGGTEIGILVALPLALRVATASLLGILADRIGDRRRALALYASLALLGGVTLWPAQGFPALFVATLATWVCWNGILPVADAVAVTVARAGGGDYGRMRVWGSISFVATNLAVGGVVAAGPPEAVLWLLTGGLALQVAATFWLPADRVAGRPAREPALVFLRGLAADRRLLGLALGSALLQAAHGTYYTFASLHWRSLGFSGTQTGVLWSIGVIGEILLFAFAATALRAIGARGLILVGAGGAILRWTLSAFLDADFGPWLVVQCLHAVTFAAVHLGTIHLITATVEDRRGATVQGTLTSLIGLTMAGAMVVSGPLFARFGGGAYLAMTGVAIAGTAMVLVGLNAGPRCAAAPTAS